MKKIVKKLFPTYINDIASEIAFPTKSFTGNFIRKKISYQSKALNKAAIDQFQPQDGCNYLELGFGRGDGLQLFHDILEANKLQGKLFGIEASSYALDKGLHRFALEVADNKIILEKSPRLILLPFTNDFFDGIYHVDVFYYWPTKHMTRIQRELFRILKPNSKIVCTMDLNRLKNWESWGLISSKDYDIMRYAWYLEPCGFENVNIKYINVEKNREIQVITANKPPKRIEDDDPEEKLKQLEMDIKYYMFEEALLKEKELGIT
ncbi:Methyltransferase type 11 domain-containing protein [Strongyloides ratti]|uniref:Methyltransferase type 11 domain-containing protein n=1 Tax=Strongyloides ratti TaxID=34506 RepID=A0A090L8F1_STRRB|nr:Methyltransferase type 11 domain-containing protein [Strongyloides ratti]CEF63740.1 Methyltransferase type 11 domain-containing protein [Strongyloides ratti]